MGTCSVEGQAIGTAAAFCVKNSLNPRSLYEDKPLLKKYQQRLLRDDQTIKNLKNEDPHDLARGAKVTASSEVEYSRADAVIDGYVRDMPGEWQHRWGGDLKSGEAWIELSWDDPQSLTQVQITFDSGFSRPLTLTEQASYRKRMITGPPPEMVQDYQVLYRPEGSDTYEVLAEVNGNYQRLRRHTFEPVRTEAIRIRITATHGNPEARIYEVRCYGETG